MSESDEVSEATRGSEGEQPNETARAMSGDSRGTAKWTGRCGGRSDAGWTRSDRQTQYDTPSWKIVGKWRHEEMTRH